MILESDKILAMLEGSKAARNITAISVRSVDEGKSLIEEVKNT